MVLRLSRMSTMSKCNVKSKLMSIQKIVEVPTLSIGQWLSMHMPVGEYAANLVSCKALVFSADKHLLSAIRLAVDLMLFLIPIPVLALS